MGLLHSLRFCAVLIAFFSFSSAAEAQFRPGIKFGMSTPDVHPEDFIVTNEQGIDLYRIFVDKARYGLHAGVFIQMQFGNFYIQPEALYNSTSVAYRIDSLLTEDAGEDLFTDTYRNIDFPVTLGMKAGPVRIGGGPVAHLHFEEEGGFHDYNGFDQFFEDLTWGWQAGIGLDLWKLHIDVRYEGNFAQLGDHITFFGERFDFDTNNNRFLASLGFSF